MSDPVGVVQRLKDTLPQVGELVWIGLRPARQAPVEVVDATRAEVGAGLVGDRYGKQGGKRQVTLINAEHLVAIGAFVGEGPVDPARLRRNLVVRGLNLHALKGRRFRVGGALLEHTGPCDPCSRMEAELGAGGFNAMRQHGGITARVLEAGDLRLGDAVRVEE
ncbi:MAG: MOSC domain-containing protein [Myxococcales bacterium]|nr:MOSC domain-containing protein [Myxococcales bacterium]MCB9526361.1 MOSC domain-containing protein [Myxococcales bacterium]